MPYTDPALVLAMFLLGLALFAAGLLLGALML